MAVTSSFEHPLSKVFREAAEGRFPPVDGVVEVVAPDRAGAHAVVEFTGHSFVLTEPGPHDELLKGLDAYGGATQPSVLTQLAGPSGSVGSLDVVMVRRAGVPIAEPLELVGDSTHPRVERALHHRRDVVVLGDHRGIVTVGIGLADRREISVELTGVAHGTGVGRELINSALSTAEIVGVEEFVFAQIAPGNAASVRMFLACGFVPIGSEVLIERRA